MGHSSASSPPPKKKQKKSFKADKNLGARWLRNGSEDEGWKDTTTTTTVPGGDEATTRFMEVDGRVSEILGDNSTISVIQRNQMNDLLTKTPVISESDEASGKSKDNVLIVTDSKRKRLDKEADKESYNRKDLIEEVENIRPKNLIEARPVLQTRLSQ
ncbi:hypothetical protein AgCh_005682 [Apium graveolens]